MAFGNIYCNEVTKIDGNSFGVILGQNYDEESEALVQLMIVITDMGKLSFIEVISLGGPIGINKISILKRYAYDVVKVLKDKGIEIAIEEEIPHFFREYSD